jgi:signal transduction histidine kinase/ActR/RegA family two-component response regulator
MSLDNIRASRIFVFDEDVGNLSLLRGVLNRLNYKSITAASDFARVETAILEKGADLIVLTLPSPDEPVLAKLKQLRTIVSRQDWMPILAIAHDENGESRKRAFAAGISEFLTKPFEWAEFVLRVRNALIIHQYNDNLKRENRVLEYLVEVRTQSLTERTAELEKALGELRGTQKQVVQQERFRAFGELAGGIAHDFNNVLMCVIGYTELLLNDAKVLASSPMVEKFLRTMNTAGNDASKIVARLRNFYRPREDADVFAPTDLSKLMEEVVPLTQPKWKNQALNGGRVIDLALKLEPVPLIACNAPEIRETVVNLIFNAVDAMPEGGTITLTSRAEDGYVCLGVGDTGVGMTEEVRQKCMEPFFSTKGEKGTGLGLAMVFGIVKRHEGTVEIESEVGKGTTFWIRLSAHLAEQGTAEITSTELSQPLRILAVDDEELPRDILTRFLSADGHEVMTAVDAYDASDKFDRHQFDLVISDHAMPGINGCQLASNLRKRGNPAILLLTGSCEEILANGVPPGLDHVVGKPITKEALRAAIAQALQRNRNRQMQSNGVELVPERASLDLSLEAPV